MVKVVKVGGEGGGGADGDDTDGRDIETVLTMTSQPQPGSRQDRNHGTERMQSTTTYTDETDTIDRYALCSMHMYMCMCVYI